MFRHPESSHFRVLVDDGFEFRERAAVSLEECVKELPTYWVGQPFEHGVMIVDHVMNLGDLLVTCQGVSKVRSTMSSAASLSRSLRRESADSCSGRPIVAWASNSRPPAMGASTMAVDNTLMVALCS